MLSHSWDEQKQFDDNFKNWCIISKNTDILRENIACLVYVIFTIQTRLQF